MIQIYLDCNWKVYVMKTTLKLTIALFIGTLLMGACQQAEEPVMEQDQTVAPVTRAFGDKTPIVAIYVETNDINPLNAGDYLLSMVRPMLIL